MEEDTFHPAPADTSAQTLDTPLSPENVPWARPLAQIVPIQTNFGPPMLLLNETPGRAWIDILIFIVLMFVFEVIAGTIIHHGTLWKLGIAAQDADAHETLIERAMLFPTIASRAVAAIIVIWLILRGRGQSWAAVGIKKSGALLDIPLGIAGVCIAYSAILIFGAVVYIFFPSVARQFSDNSERLMELFPPLDPWQFVPVALLIGIYEELIFRGFLMPRLRRGMGSWMLAVLVSTAIFTGLHSSDQTKPALVMIGTLSITFSVLTIVRKSILPAILAHFLFDLSQLLLLHYSSGGEWK